MPAGDRIAKAVAGVTPPGSLRTMALRDARTLAWAEWGPPEGLPILFCTGAAMSRSMGFGVNHLFDLNIRLIAIDRPGLGASSPHPQKTLTSWADDLAEFISAHELKSAGAVGFSQGAPYALALGSRNLVQAVSIVSGQDEFANPRMKPLTHPDIQRMVDGIRDDATGFEDWFAGFATQEGLWQLIVGGSSELDKALYLEERFAEAYRRTLNEGFSQGVRHYARDLVNTFGPWPFALEQIEVPVDLWFGAMDASTGHSPDFGVTMAKRLPKATRTLDPDEGGSILWTRSRDILTKLRTHLLTA